MFWNKYSWSSMIVLVAVAILHWKALFDELYWEFHWYDIMMHILGGMWVALFILWIAKTQYGGFVAKYLSIKKLIIAVIIVGLLWEGLELMLRFTDISDAEYLSDSSLDMLMDVVGACVVICIYRKDFNNFIEA